MAKLYFRHGAVGSAKTLNLLAVAHNYSRQGKRVRVIKPAFDTRFGARSVASRAGLEREADIVLGEDDAIPESAFSGCHCVLVDEAQFLTPRQVEELRELTRRCRVPVICYGLRGDFRTRAFAGSVRLFELADSVEEVKTTCAHCNRKAIFNLKSVAGEATLDGPSKQLGAEETYLPVCYHHYMERLQLRTLADTDAAVQVGDADAHER